MRLLRTLNFPCTVAAGLTLMLCFPRVAIAEDCQPEDRRVTINHELGTVSPDGTLRLRHAEFFCIEIVTTRPECITVNLVEVPIDPLAAGPAPPIAFRVHHHEDTGAYKVAIGVKKDKGCENVAALERVIPVETYGWSLAVAGGFTADTLTDPVFFLEKGERPKPTVPPSVESGFFVRERSAAEDDFKLGAATFVHLYHNDPDRFGGGGVNWVPLSFGLGIGDAAQAKYLFGTGLRFGNLAYLAGGVALGGRKRLPDSLNVGDFTADQNALKTLPVHSTTEWFLSLSLRGLDIDVSRLSAPFKTKTPTP